MTRKQLRDEMDDFRAQLRGEVFAVLDEDPDSCLIDLHKSVKRDSGCGEYHEKQLDFTRDSQTEEDEEEESANHENDEGGFRNGTEF